MAGKTPIRTCVACGTARDKRELVRVVRSPQGDVSLDVRGRAPGRGAYLCLDEACLEKAMKKRLFDSRLRTKLTPEDYEGIAKEFRAVCAQGAGTDAAKGR